MFHGAAATCALAIAVVAQEPVVPRPGSIDLDALVKELDPGDAPPLGALLPDWLRARLMTESTGLSLNLGTHRDGAKRLEADAAEWARTLLKAEDKWKPEQGEEATLQALAVYQLVLRVWFAGATFGESTSWSFPAAFAKWHLDREQTAEVRRVMAALPDAIDARVRHVAVNALRTREPRLVVSALELLALRAATRRDSSDVLHLREEVVRRGGSAASPRQWRALAMSYYQELEVELGDLAAAEARKTVAEEPQREESETDDLGSTARAARAALALRDRQDVDGTMERASLLMQIGRSRDARAELAELSDAFPDDARPCVALARLAYPDVAAMQRALDRAAACPNKDAAYYDLAFYVACISLRSPPIDLASAQAFRLELVSKIDELAAGMIAIGNPRAELLGAAARMMLASTDRESLFRAAGDNLPLLLCLRERDPESAEIAALVVGAASTGGDAETALATLSAPLPKTAAAVPGLARVRASAWFARAVAQGPKSFAELATAFAGLPDDDPVVKLLAGTALVVDMRWNGEKNDDSLASAETALRRAQANLASKGDDELEAVAWNNLGVVLVARGATDSASHAFLEAVTRDPSATEPVFNLIVMDPERRAHALAAWLAATDDAPRAHGEAWLGCDAEKRGDRDAARSAFRQACDDLGDSWGDETQWNGAGLLASGAFRIGANYKRMTTEVQCITKVRPWLLLPAPVTREALHAAAGR